MATHDDGNILHEKDTEDSVIDELEKSGQVGYDNTHIADPASPGASYVQAEVVALRTAIVGILDILEANGLMAAS